MRKLLHRIRHFFLPSHHNAYRPHVLKKQWLIFFLTMVLTAEGVLVAGHVLKQTGIEFLAAVVPGEIIAFTNVERAQASLGTVTESTTLSAAAQAKAQDMAVHGYFAHVGPDGKEPWAWIEEAGYRYTHAGENLAVRFTESSDVVEAWMASPSHRANIVKLAYTEIGVGVAEGLYEGRPATFVVQYFGTPRAEEVVATTIVPVAEAAEVADTAPAAEEAEESVVQGAATGVAEVSPVTLVPAVVESQSMFQTYMRALAEGIMRADTSALWLIGGIAALLVIALALAFFIHLQVQPTDMIMSGATVAVIALSLLAINMYYVPTGSTNSYGAAVATALPDGVVDPHAVFIEQP